MIHLLRHHWPLIAFMAYLGAFLFWLGYQFHAWAIKVSLQ